MNSKDSRPPAKVQSGKEPKRPWNIRINKHRLLWFIASVVLFVISTAWFVWLEPVYSDSANPPRSFSWWIYPHENNAYKRLPVLPFSSSSRCFFTNDLGWIACDGGVILHTGDGGKSWIVQTNIDWGASDSTSGNPTGGALQQKRIAREPQDLRVIQFIDGGQHGWVVGAAGTILCTDDGGQTWVAQESNTKALLESVNFIDLQHGWIAGNQGTILHTDDGGHTWEKRLGPPAKAKIWFRSVKFVTADRGWISGSQGTILHTEDGGKNWDAQDVSKVYGWLQCVTLLDSSRGWIVGEDGVILHMEDGEHWTVQTNLPTKAWVECVIFADAQRGWAADGNGVIWKTDNGGANWHPQSINTQTPINSLSFADARRGWAVGLGGAVLYTEDGGQTWTPQTASAKTWLDAINFVDKDNGWAVGGGGVILHTSDGGRNWASQTITNKPLLEAASFTDKDHGWVVGHGIIIHTQDGGRTWIPQSAGNEIWFRSVKFVNSQRGWIVGQRGAIFHTEDGGHTWSPQDSKTSVWLQCIDFVDDLRGWIVGANGTVLHTEDGGMTWSGQTNRNQLWLECVSFSDPHHGWIVGDGGTILRTSDGGQTWDAQPALTKAPLRSVVALSEQNAWAVGWDGTILKTENGGQTWISQSARVPLASVKFADKQHGWVAGSNVILRTDDGGVHWYELQPYRRWPAPILWILLLVSFVLSLTGLRVMPPPPAVDLIADYGVSDRPLSSKDFDALNFGPLADGIANFLHNKNTIGPLTLAITGPWGSGKSSLMSLLKDKLVKRGFQPVWFNAWHHQQEDQMFAALLESIRSDAIPSLTSFSGLMFRQRLIRQRLRWKWPVVLCGAMICAVVGGVIRSFGFSIEGLQNLGTFSIILLAGKLAAIAGAVVAVKKVCENFKAFGVDPSKLLASVAEKATVSDLSGLTSFRHRFAKEFEDVTAALQPRTMTVFIDDLDRCESAQVMHVMQSLNFLASSGECFLVIGMEEEVVTNCIAEGFKKQFATRGGQNLTKDVRVRRRWDHARRWMEKLIQIRVPVPTANLTQIEALLRREPPAPSTGFKTILKSIARFKKPALLVFGLCSLTFLTFEGTSCFLSTFKERGSSHPATLTHDHSVAWPSESIVSPNNLKSISLEMPDSVMGKSIITNTDLTNWLSSRQWAVKLEFDPQRIQTKGAGEVTPTSPALFLAKTNPIIYAPNLRMPFKVQAGQMDHSGWEIPLICLIVLIYFFGTKIIERFDIVIKDSDDFRNALNRWSRRINQTRKTPRSVKRLINKLRFYAMVFRALSQSKTDPPVSERAIVAFGILEDEPDDILAKYCGGDAIIAIDADLKSDVDEMVKAITTHRALFQFLSSSIRMESESDK